ncbi:hypothetical protein JXD38_08705 [candidate division WOR-3 bacterium]|nr:hypothetical protein [candidate division WOR-3 bacterium]
MRRALVGVLLVTLGAVTAWAWSIWSPIGPALFPVLCGAISSSNPQVAVVAVSRGTTAVLYFTTDRGSNWSTTTGFPAFRPLATVFEHGSDSILYAVAGDVFRSTDRGQTWSQLAMPDGSVWLNVALNPTDSNEIWLAGYSDASMYGRASVAASTDAGTTWTMLVCDTTLRSSAHSIAVDPTRDSTLYCGGSIAGRAVVYKSTDRGSTWAAHDLPSPTKADSGAICSPPAQEVPVPGRVRFLYVNPLNPSVLLAAQPWYGICRSTNGGTSWYHYPGFSEAHSLAFSPLQPQTVYVGVTSGIFRTTNGGQFWGGPYQPPRGGLVDWIMAFADSAGEALATNGAGVFRTRWGDWDPVSVIDTVNVTALTSQFVYAAIADVGVFRSIDDGGAWNRCGSFPGADSVVALAVDPGDVWALADVGLYCSADSGGTWVCRGDWFDSAGSVVVSSLMPDVILAAGKRSDSLAVSCSSDRGTTWSHSLLCRGGMGRAAALSPTDPGRALVGGDSAGNPVLYTTRDTGRTWLRVGAGLTGSVHCLVFASGQKLLGGTSAGVFHSLDTGQTWQYEGLSHVNAIVLAGWEGFAGTDSGVFATQGGNWFAYSYGLVDSVVSTVSVMGMDSVYVGTRTAGLFLGHFPVGIDDSRNDARRPTSVGPTIFRGALLLSSRQASYCLLLSADGRKVMDLMPGANDVRLQAPGVYFIRGPTTEDGRPGAAVRKVVITR